jgi:hypothetical protein
MTKPSLTLPVMPPEHRRILLETMADHFRLPARRCRIRGCRRKGICDGLLGAAGKPACFGRLHPNDVARCDKIMAVMTEIYRGTLWGPPAKDGDRKWDQETAIAIYRAALPRMPERSADFERVLARFNAPPAPPVDVQAFLAEAKLELARWQHDDAMEALWDPAPATRARTKNAAAWAAAR